MESKPRGRRPREEPIRAPLPFKELVGGILAAGPHPKEPKKKPKPKKG